MKTGSDGLTWQLNAGFDGSDKVGDAVSRSRKILTELWLKSVDSRRVLATEGSSYFRYVTVVPSHTDFQVTQAYIKI